MITSTKIKKARESKGLTQTDLAAKLGMDQPTVSKWERGRRKPARSKLKRLSQIIGIPLEELL